MIRRRAELHNDPRIIEKEEMLYRTFVTPHQNAKGQISREEMLDVQVKICKALFNPEEWDIGVAVEAAAEDWERDNPPNAIAMSHACFLDSLFEVVDIWTETVCRDEYIEFLDKLFHRIAKKCEDGSYQWKDLKHISSMYAEMNDPFRKKQQSPAVAMLPLPTDPTEDSNDENDSGPAESATLEFKEDATAAPSAPAEDSALENSSGKRRSLWGTLKKKFALSKQTSSSIHNLHRNHSAKGASMKKKLKDFKKIKTTVPKIDDGGGGDGGKEEAVDLTTWKAPKKVVALPKLTEKEADVEPSTKVKQPRSSPQKKKDTETAALYNPEVPEHAAAKNTDPHPGEKRWNPNHHRKSVEQPTEPLARLPYEEHPHHSKNDNGHWKPSGHVDSSNDTGYLGAWGGDHKDTEHETNSHGPWRGGGHGAGLNGDVGYLGMHICVLLYSVIYVYIIYTYIFTFKNNVENYISIC
jgi:hypothetical protein